MTPDFWRGRRVFLTGHTGFKGGWLALMLRHLGAEVSGFGLPPVHAQGVYLAAEVEKHVSSSMGDIRDYSALLEAGAGARAEVVFHLAAQSLVLASYADPLETLSTNVMGTAHVLEMARHLPEVRAVVVVTTDKVYENREWLWGYREVDELGGRDPYSSSKACAELVTRAYRDSFLCNTQVGVATARAGNVIGGGDWAANRLVPDLVRAVLENKPLSVRNPHGVRPWQHVLEPLEGYLLLAEGLLKGKAWQGPWNFGPAPEALQPVATLAGDLATLWGPEASWEHDDVDSPHESTLLTLDATKARHEIGWSPRLGYQEGLRWTVEWYKAMSRGENLAERTMQQIKSYCELFR